MNLDSENLKNTSTEENPYAYLERDFSSENYKIEVKNLPKFYGISEFRKLLNNKLKLNSNKIKTTKKNSPFAFICFRNDEDRDKAIETLSNYNWKGKILQVMKAKPAPDPLVKKRKQDSKINDPKKLKTELNQEERLKNSTIPYWNIEYKQQLEMKIDTMKKLLCKFGNELVKLNPDLIDYIEKQKLINDGLICQLSEIRSADVYEGYRNKCEFSVGLDEETNLPTVGFRIGSYVDGTIGVAPVDNLVHIPDIMKLAVKLFERYVRDSELKVFNPETHEGHFRQLTARAASASRSLMLVVGIHPQHLTDEKISNFKESLVKFFSDGDGKQAGVTSLYYQKIVKKNHDADTIPPEHLWGDTHIQDTILGMKFKISPQAFFQINSKAAEVLYKTAMELAEPLDNSTVLDVCCGTGTIGLCFAKKCKQVLGIEMVAQAVNDAVANAAENSVQNARFFTGKAEQLLGTVCFEADADRIVAVLDPPRAGLHKQAILQVRKVPKISKVIYVSCNPSAAFENFLDMGKRESKKVRGDILLPTKAIAVDMFPFTKHCELLVLFERWQDIESKSQPVEKK